LLEGWPTTDRVAWNAMKVRAQTCFQQRFDIERTAESLVRAFDIHGLMPTPAKSTFP
jgi:hypothetical protein